MNKGLIIFLALLGFSPGQELLSQTEYEVKAAYLYNFAKFVRWPANTFADKEDPIIIGIIGRDPFNGYLSQVISGKTIRGRKLEIQSFKRTEDFSSCHILFVGSSEKRNLNWIMQKIENSNILTISELSNFLEEGGIIRLFNKGNKVRFDINLEAVQQSTLDMSSRVLNLAENLKLQTNGRE